MRSLPSFACLALVLSFSCASRADEQRDPAAAAFLFKEGRKAFETKDFAAACPKFAESFRLDPAPGTLLNLAACEEARGQTASAWQHYQQAAERLPTGDDRIPIAKSLATALEAKLPRLALSLSPSVPAGTHVSRDGVELGAASLGGAFPVNPGSHTIVVTADGFEPRGFDVTIEAGETKSVALDVGPKKAAVVAPVATAPTSGPRRATSPDEAPPPAAFSRRAIGFAAGVVGVVGLVTAGVTGGLLLSKRSTVRSECDAAKACSASGTAAADTGKTLVPINTAAWIVGFVGIGAGAYLVLSGDRGAGPKTVVAAAPDAHGGSIVAAGRF